MTVWIVVVAAGSGSRFAAPSSGHARPKQYEILGDRRVLDWSVDGARAHADGVVVVVAREFVAEVAASLGERAARVVAGGATRAASVRAGLAAVPEAAQFVLVHDAARPLADSGVYERVLAALRAGAGAVVPVVPVTDSIRDASGHAVDRATLLAVQTPQGFAAPLLRLAHRENSEASDDATLVEAVGGKVVTVLGDPANFKITNAPDLAAARALVEGRLK